MKKILIFDNYDSFTYNLLHLVRELGFEAEVHRNDQIALEAINDYDKIILSPGPGIPSEAGLMLPLVEKYAPTKSILGVCLGHQGIAQSFGGQLDNLDQVYHGVAMPVKVIDKDYIFNDLPASFDVGRYHSWIVKNTLLPDDLVVTALSEEGYIMALKHREYDIHGVQFHPESVLTSVGATIMKNFLTH
ncbi:MAG: aminodeoxychorismate/anthranilate synthase component II [Candidatus Azobacteroides sp.]|nr:aminodeoxychorismate/anthranilate synthase component II [Candidatus Azobacteroides sp.]